jgi:ectoine hydroxylase-related dioxygenase (phytanoyl-CoA dioxygenase family)
MGGSETGSNVMDLPEPLSAEQVDQYLTEGYTIADAFFDERESAALRAEVARWQDSGRLRNVATDGDGSTPSTALHNLQLVPLQPHSALYRSLPFHPRVIGAVRQLIGDPVTKILDQVFLKPAHTGIGTNWHTDNGYFRIKAPLKGTAMWIALDDASRENGTIKVIPGRFNERFDHERDPYSDHHIRTHVDESDAVHCEVRAGGVVFFCFGTPHATGDNPSDTARAGCGVHFLNDDARSERARYAERVFLTGRRADGGADDYGEDLRGRFEDEVNAVLGAAGKW